MKDLTWCLMLYLSDNMWDDCPDPSRSCTGSHFHTHLTTEKPAWDEVTEFAAKNGCNSILVDVGDGIKYKSHPEISVEGAWEPEFMKEEIKRLNSLGLEVYPKLNFSAAHDAWLGVYGRMLSTKTYYQVVRDLILEVAEIFGKPELFHVGMDEEDEMNQKRLTYACYRQFELMWHDLNFYFDCVREAGCRPWIWGDQLDKNPQEFIENVPKDVLVSPWYYAHMFPDVSAPLPDDKWSQARLASYGILSDAGYDVLPCASNLKNTYNYDHTIRYTREHVAPEHNKGLLNAPWVPTCERNKYRLMDAVQVAKFDKLRLYGEEAGK